MEYSAKQFLQDLENLSDNDVPPECKYIQALCNGIEDHKADFCKVLLSLGLIKNINYQQIESKYTPLMIAVEYERHELIKILLEHGADTEYTTIYGNTALLLAVIYQNHEIMKILLDAGANVNVINTSKYTPLMYAIDNSQIDDVKLLIEKGAKIDIDNLIMLIDTHDKDDVEILKLLMQGIKGKCCYGETCLNLAKGLCKLEHEIIKDDIINPLKIHTTETIKDE